MKFVWTMEPSVTGPTYLARVPAKGNAPFVHIGVRHWSSKDKGKKKEWIVTILEPGMPSAGPYASAQRAGEWAENFIIKKLFPEAQFSSWPKRVKE